jgi:ferredoxin
LLLPCGRCRCALLTVLLQLSPPLGSSSARRHARRSAGDHSHARFDAHAHAWLRLRGHCCGCASCTSAVAPGLQQVKAATTAGATTIAAAGARAAL